MIKEIKKIRNNKIDYLNLLDNHLSIQLSLDGFSFCIYNKIQKEIGAFEVFEFSNNTISPQKQLELVKNIYDNNELLSLKYHSVRVVHYNNLVTQVPKPFFDKNNLKSYLQYSIKLLENDFVAFDMLSNTAIVNIYVPFVNINNFLLDKYGSFTFKHSSTILIEKLIHRFKNFENDVCIVNVTKNKFEMIVLKNHKLALYNYFDFTTKEDFIYYILFTAEQLNLNPEEFKLFLMGDIEKESELYDMLYKYIRNISFFIPKNFPKALHSISKHAYFTLLNQL